MKHKPRPAIHMEKQLGWAHKLDGEESKGISRVEQTVSQADGVSDMALACWLCASVWGGFRKGTMTSAHLDARHFSFSLYATGVFQAATLVLEPRSNGSE